MSPKLEAGVDGKRSAGPLDVTVEQSLSPAPFLNTEAAIRDNRNHIPTDKPYSVFTHKEKWLIVILASCAAIFRRVGYFYVHISISLMLAPLTRKLVLSLRIYISLQFPSSQETSTKA